MNTKQFVFQSRKSSTDAVFNFIEKTIVIMEDNNNTSAVFLDLAKAFNSFSHEIFLEKSENFIFSQSTFLPLKLFLENRTQCVQLGIDSDKITINHGVPQGTVLGSLILLLYVNYFPEILKGENDIVQFAEHTSIICKFERNEKAPQKLRIIKTDRQIPDRESTHFKCR